MKPKYKVGQTIETAEEFGKILEVRIREDKVTYLLSDEEGAQSVDEAAVTAVYKPVQPRKSKPRAEKPAKAERKGKAA